MVKSRDVSESRNKIEMFIKDLTSEPAGLK